ncbi:MAG TPA: hypothetical protein VGH73_20960 [Thermoanaerobaculia bacterium]|jgi:hypothetical protein
MRRTYAAAGLTAALLLAVPAPSRAVSFRPSALADLMGGAWSWLESLLPGARVPAAPAQGPKGSVAPTRTDTPPVVIPPPSTTDQGSMIDPDGKH